MAYEYRSYYGRTILNEIDYGHGDQGDWVFDEDKHRYRLMNDAEKLAKEFKESERVRKVQEKISEAREKEVSKKRSKDVVQRKKEIKAARVIQRWWRRKLYEPPNGILYKRSLESFNAHLKTSTS
jgi:predicted secreted protein